MRRHSRKSRAAVILGALAVLALAPSRAAHARWATEKDASSAVEFENFELEVSADGTYQEQVEQQIEILKEQARREQGARRLSYNASAGKLKVLKAEVIADGKREEADSSMIEDKPLASAGAGFDQLHQILISFPDVNPGSKTYLKYRRDVSAVPFKGFFSQRFHFNPYQLTRQRHVHIVSELPLFVEKHDPAGSLVIEESRDGDRYVVDAKLSKPVYEAVTDEDAPSIISSDRTWFAVASSRSHAEMVKSVIPKYEEILDSPLPELFERFRKEAAAFPGAIDRINSVTANLAQSVRYMGDWRTVEGGYVPRPLETVAKTLFGDCKDFATVTAAVLRKLGMTAHVAWVERDYQPDLFPKLPLEAATNHAIVQVRMDGRTLWVDPTNFQSFAQGTFPDIIGRSALVLEPGATQLVQEIPRAEPSGSVYSEKFALAFDAKGDGVIDVRMDDAGRMALNMTGEEQKFSKESLDYSIVTTIANASHVKEYKVGTYDLKSRIVRDLSFSARIKTHNSVTRTSAGLGYRLPAPAHMDSLINLETRKRGSDFFITQPYTFEREMELKNIRVIGEQYRGCEIKSPWVDIRRSFERTADGLRVRDGFELLTDRVSNAELRSAGFADFQSKLQRCFDRVEIVFVPRGKVALK